MIHDKSIIAAREKVASLQSQIQEFEINRILSKAEAIGNVDRYVDRILADAADRANQAAICASRGDMPIDSAWSEFAKPEHVAVFATWLDPDAVRGKLHAAVDAHYTARGDEGIASADRPVRLAKLRRELLDAEQAEFALVEKARAAGAAIEQRGDLDPRVLLGLTP